MSCASSKHGAKVLKNWQILACMTKKLMKFLRNSRNYAIFAHENMKILG